MAPPHSLEPILFCNVCGAPDASFHYGGLSCDSCRLFFYRRVQSSSTKSRCKTGKNDCQIVPKSGKNCKECRWRKCREIGMQPSEVGNQDYKRSKPNVVSLFEKNSAPRKSTTVELTDESRLREVSKWPGKAVPLELSLPQEIASSYSAGFLIVSRVQKFEKATDFVNFILALEDFINNPSGLSPSEVYANVNVSLAEVLLNSQAANHKFNPHKDEQYSVRHGWCRTFASFADFVTTVPEFFALEERDKMKLVQGNYSNVFYVSSSHREISISGELREANQARYRSFTHNAEVQKLSKAKLRTASAIIEKASQIRISKGEVAILKYILLFNPPVGISENGMRIVQSARNKYCLLMSNYIFEQNPGITMDDQIKRVADLLEFTQVLSNSLIGSFATFKEIIASNVDELAGQLTHDLHFRDF